MELVARQAVEGFLSGKHPSPYFGSSVEYADHRPYSVGDEPRSIDWKLLAKTDKYYIKLFEEQTNVRCTIVVDTSRSMAFTSGDMSKLEYGTHLAAALTYLLLRQNDAVGLALFDSQVRQYLPPRATASHFSRIIEVMENAVPAADTRLGDVLHELAGRLPRRSMVVLVSDLLDDPERIARGLAHFRHQRNEVIVFHLMDPQELTFPYERLTRFKDPEGTSMVVANPRTVRRRYMERLNDFMARIRRSCHERGVDYQLAQTDVPYDKLLSNFLEQRARLKQRRRK